MIDYVCDVKGCKGSERWHVIKIEVDEGKTEMHVCNDCYEGLDITELREAFGQFIDQRYRDRIRAREAKKKRA